VKDDWGSRASTQYSALNVAEPLAWPRWRKWETFRATHKDSFIKPVETIPSPACRAAACARRVAAPHPPEWSIQTFPAAVATKLSQQFTQHGLHFRSTRRSRTSAWASAVPRYREQPVSDGIKRIVEHINAKRQVHPKKLD